MHPSSHSRRLSHVVAATWLLVLLAVPVDAAKVLVFKPPVADPEVTVSTRRAVDLAPYKRLGVSLVAEYALFYLVSVPDVTKEAFIAATRSNGLGVQVREDFDRIRINGYVFPSSIENPELPSDLTIRDYAGKTGLFLVQMVGPNRPEWWSEMEKAGTPIAYFPDNTFLLRARGADARALLGRSGFQHVSAYQPAFKVRLSLTMAEEAPMPVAVSLDGGQDTSTVVRMMQAMSGQEVDLDGEGPIRTAVTVLMPSDARLLALLPEVVWVEPHIGGEPSDERQALTLAGRHDGTMPTNPGTYMSWLQSKGFCTATRRPPGCYDYWTKVAVFDSGIDKNVCPSSAPECPGGTRQQHPDFGSRVVQLRCANKLDGTNHCLGADTAYPGQYSYSDKCEHGTAVASLLAGDPTQGVEALGISAKDSQAFYLGTGVAPLAQLLPFRIWDDSCWWFGSLTDPFYSPADFGRWYAQLPAFPTTRFSTNSWNQRSLHRSDLPGDFDRYAYTSLSRKFDELVRDANGGFNDNSHPITIVFSAGNIDPATSISSVEGPANAKNVIAAGAAESYRTSDVAPWNNSTVCGEAQSIKNIAGISARGVRDDGNRFKPDLVVPTTRSGVAFTRSGEWAYRSCIVAPASNDPNGRYYTRFYGTSAAAPLVAGSAVLADTWYYNRNGGSFPSPAMLKAMLVAHADDLIGGIDKVTGNPIPIHRPSFEQGWGRVNLDKLFQTTVPVKYYDQDATPQGLRRFIPGKGSWTVNLQVANPTKEVILVLAFTDRYAQENAGTLSVNNVDLYVLDGGWQYQGNDFLADGFTRRAQSSGYPDWDNTVEMIRIRPGEVVNGDFTVEVVPGVNAKAVPGLDGSSPNQDFALYIYNAQ